MDNHRKKLEKIHTNAFGIHEPEPVIFWSFGSGREQESSARDHFKTIQA